MRNILCLSVFLFLATACLGASPERREGDVHFRVSTSTFYERGAKNRVEVYYEVPYEQLNFLKTDTLYTASFDISVIFYDSLGEQAGGDIWRKEAVVNDYDESQASSKGLTSGVDFRTSPGSYRMRARLEDLSSAKFGVIERDVLVRSFGNDRLELSDPTFLHYMFDTLATLNPSRRYSKETRAAVRFEIYSPAGTDSFSMETSLVDSRGKVWNKGAILVKGGSRLTRTVVFSLDSLPQDTISFVIRLDETAEARWPFFVSIPFFLSTEEYMDRVDAMRYVADEEELKKMREAPPEERALAYEAFWRERDPIPSTERNEAEEEYFGRVEYTNTHFGGLYPGWKTDRGRIYIQYGRPDEVEKYPFEIDYPPFEVWYYYGLGLRLYFVDRHNLGTYELEGWERK